MLAFPLLLKRVYDDKDVQESNIKSSGLDWTIVRPGLLTHRWRRYESLSMSECLDEAVAHVLERRQTCCAAWGCRPAKVFDYRFCCVKLCLRPFVRSGKSVAHA